jgi:hypothetical protein
VGVMPKREKGPAAAAGSGRRHVSEERSACSSPLTIATFEGGLETNTSERGTTPGARRVGGCHSSAECMQSEEKVRCGGAGPPPKKGRGCDAEGAKTHAHCPAHASGNWAAGTRSNPRFSIFDLEDCVTPLLPLVRASERKIESESGLMAGGERERSDRASASSSTFCMHRDAPSCLRWLQGACARRRVAGSATGAFKQRHQAEGSV